jgi:integrase
MTKSDVRLLLNNKIGMPEAQNNRLKDLRALFAWALNHGDEYDLILPDDFRNPCAEIKKNQPAKDATGFHTWTIEEVHQFKDCYPVGTMERLAISILLYTGARVSDAYLLGRTNEKTWLDKTTQQQINMLSFRAQKNGQQCDVPILPELREAIDACPSGNLIYLATSRGSPFKSAKAFSQWFVKKRKLAKLPDACVPHGLRKAGATFAAEAGATERQLMAMFGWKDPEMARKYTVAAENRKMAAETMYMVTGEQK